MITIITVTKNDAWKLSKTIRNVYHQNFGEYEHVVVDGMSEDGTESLCKFWLGVSDRFRYVRREDQSLYDAMNIGVQEANGDIVCFLNAGDLFTHPNVLNAVSAEFNKGSSIDGLIGWGSWRKGYWATWWPHRSLYMSSNGFCHQALFLKRDWLVQFPFVLAAGKTDSDSEQLARCIDAGAKVAVLPELIAERFPDQGISARLWSDDFEGKDCVQETIEAKYPLLSRDEVSAVLKFRRGCQQVEEVLSLMNRSRLPQQYREDIAVMVLDTLCQPQAARNLPGSRSSQLAARAVSFLSGLASGQEGLQHFARNRQAFLDFLQYQAAIDSEKAHQAQRFNDAYADKLERRMGRIPERSKRSHAKRPVVVLTSFPARTATLHTVIKSLLSQTVSPGKIIITLGLDEFHHPEWLPGRLKALLGETVQINWIDSTRNQYDKFMSLPSELRKNNDIILVDDDLVYPENAIELLVSGSEAHPGCVIANRCHRMTFDEDGRLAPYEQWIKESASDAPSLDLFPTGAGGVLYPAGFFDEFVLEENEILEVAPYADDIWLKLVAVRRGMSTFATAMTALQRWYLEYVPNMLESSLYQSNVLKGLNDLQFRALDTELANSGSLERC